MPAPRDKGQLTPWLKKHRYQWVLKSPAGEIVTIAEAIKQIEKDEQERYEEHDLFTIEGVYYTDGAVATNHVWGGQHDDDTHEFFFFMSDPVNTEERDDTIRYTFADSVILIQHDGILETEQEWRTEREHKG